MKKSIAIIVGGTGQFGVLLAEKLLKKKYKVIITTRSVIKAKKKIIVIREGDHSLSAKKYLKKIHSELDKMVNYCFIKNIPLS